MQVMPETVSSKELMDALKIDYTIWRRNLLMHSLRLSIAPHLDKEDNPRLETAYFFLSPERVNIRSSRVIASWVRGALIQGKVHEPIHFEVDDTRVRFHPSEFPVNDLMELVNRGYHPQGEVTYPYQGSDSDGYVCLAVQMLRDEKKLFGLDLNFDLDKVF